MMIVELIDGDDFRARLTALGIDIPDGADPDTCARIAAQAHQQKAVPGLPALVHELMAQQAIMLPSVRQAIERFLPFE
ncbi:MULTISPECIES: hypothetical protein [Halomonas]|uniref:Uncharacterized protein n=1 Tax=Halomonas casei TaxID=2742613 RepID=A0ABR9F1A3_9GAMM|nr:MULTISPECIES: hypothetical protein [Halomonas]MBE0400245.1 hypothetical protein [Halomonas casei]PCC21072.1 hypothetical protein CIK78_02670 [Halomonas sp. JB37]